MSLLEQPPFDTFYGVAVFMYLDSALVETSDRRLAIAALNKVYRVYGCCGLTTHDCSLAALADDLDLDLDRDLVAGWARPDRRPDDVWIVRADPEQHTDAVAVHWLIQ